MKVRKENKTLVFETKNKLLIIGFNVFTNKRLYKSFKKTDKNNLFILNVYGNGIIFLDIK